MSEQPGKSRDILVLIGNLYYTLSSIKACTIPWKVLADVIGRKVPIPRFTPGDGHYQHVGENWGLLFDGLSEEELAEKKVTKKVTDKIIKEKFKDAWGKSVQDEEKKITGTKPNLCNVGTLRKQGGPKGSGDRGNILKKMVNDEVTIEEILTKLHEFNPNITAEQLDTYMNEGYGYLGDMEINYDSTGGSHPSGFELQSAKNSTEEEPLLAPVYERDSYMYGKCIDNFCDHGYKIYLEKASKILENVKLDKGYNNGQELYENIEKLIELGYKEWINEIKLKAPFYKIHGTNTNKNECCPEHPVCSGSWRKTKLFWYGLLSVMTVIKQALETYGEDARKKLIVHLNAVDWAPNVMNKYLYFTKMSECTNKPLDIQKVMENIKDGKNWKSSASFEEEKSWKTIGEEIAGMEYEQFNEKTIKQLPPLYVIDAGSTGCRLELNKLHPCWIKATEDKNSEEHKLYEEFINDDKIPKIVAIQDMNYSFVPGTIRTSQQTEQLNQIDQFINNLRKQVEAYNAKFKNIHGVAYGMLGATAGLRYWVNNPGDDKELTASSVIDFIKKLKGTPDTQKGGASGTRSYDVLTPLIISAHLLDGENEALLEQAGVVSYMTKQNIENELVDMDNSTLVMMSMGGQSAQFSNGKTHTSIDILGAKTLAKDCLTWAHGEGGDGITKDVMKTLNKKQLREQINTSICGNIEGVCDGNIWNKNKLDDIIKTRETPNTCHIKVQPNAPLINSYRYRVRPIGTIPTLQSQRLPIQANKNSPPQNRRSMDNVDGGGEATQDSNQPLKFCPHSALITWLVSLSRQAPEPKVEEPKEVVEPKVEEPKESEAQSEEAQSEEVPTTHGGNRKSRRNNKKTKKYSKNLARKTRRKLVGGNKKSIKRISAKRITRRRNKINKIKKGNKERLGNKTK